MSAAARVLMFSGELASSREIDSCWETLAVSAVVRPSSGVTSLTSRAPPGGVETWSGCVGAGMRGSAGTGGAAGNTNRYAQRMTQIAVKLPDELVRELDELVAQGHYSSRSSAVRRAVEMIVSRQRRDALEEAYAKGYRQAPESENELAEAKRLAAQAIDDEPWEKWW